MLTPEEVQRRLEPRFGPDVTQAVLIYAWQNGCYETGKSWGFFYQLARWRRDSAHKLEARRRKYHAEAMRGISREAPGQEARVAVRELLESMPASVHDALMTPGNIRNGKRHRVLRWRKQLRKKSPE